MAGPWEKYAPQGDQGAADGPWAKYRSPAPAEPEPEPQTGAGQAALEHFGNAAAMGYLPQAQALASKATPDPNADLDAKLKSQGFDIQQSSPTYVQERDANIKRLEQESKDHPIASAAGTVGGALSSAVATSAAAPINAAGRIGRILQAGKGGAILGALSNPGDVEGQLTGLQLGDRAKNAVAGAGMSAAGQGLIEGVSSAARGVTNLPAALQSKAEERAFKASGAMLKDYRKAAGQGRVNELGRYMLDNGLIKPGMSVDDIAQAAASLKSKEGEAIGGILRKLDESGANGPSAHDLAAAVEKQALPLKDLNTAQPTYKTLQDVAGDIRTLGKEPPIGVSHGEVGKLTGRGTEYLVDPQTEEVMAQFRNGKLVTASGSLASSAESASAETVATPGNLSTEIPGSFQGAQDIKKFISDQVEASGGWKSLNPSEKNKALQDVYSMVSKKIEESAGKAAEGSGDKELLQSYLGSKAGYRNSKELVNIAKDQALRQNANHFLSPTDYLSGATGAMIGAANGEGLEGKLKGAAMGAGMGLVNKAARSYGAPLVSLGLDKAGALLAKTPLSEAGRIAAPVLSAAERSPVALSAAESVLSQPQFERAAVRSVAAEPPKGEDRWAQSGLKSLGINDPATTQRLMSSPKGKQLLIQASDLKPGSKAMQKVNEQIQQLLKGAR